MFKVVWRFNLADGIDEATFFEWLKTNVWASSAKYGCETRAFRINKGPHTYSTEAAWPSEAARGEWVASADFRAIPAYPGTGSPWGAQVDMEAVEYRPM
ncbi:MAG: hypothetical protein K0R39_4678 [Symbiobacteriaceae bacterium]|jgi:hypothetical protein|nr:hypothetical protein [Symbiobacteriaceae bacterium]